jgi:hypothetical protein
LTTATGDPVLTGTKLPTHPSGPARREVVLVCVGALAFAGLFLVDDQLHGALGVSRNDDWTFLKVAFHLADAHRIALNGFAQMMLVGQPIAAWPINALFHDSITALQIAVAILGAGGVAAAYLVLRRFLSPPWAALACLTLVVGPFFGELSTSYMTDVPAFALEAVALLLGIKALERRSISFPLLVASGVVGFLAFSVREYGAIAFAAVMAAAVCKVASGGSRKQLLRVVVLGSGVLMACLALYVWRHSLAYDVSTQINVSTGHLRSWLEMLPKIAFTLAFLVSPVAIAISPVRALSRVWSRSPFVSILVVVATGGALALNRHDPFVGNSFTLEGTYPGSVPGRWPPLLGPLPWLLVRLIAAYALLMLLAVLTLAVWDMVSRVRMKGVRSAVQDASTKLAQLMLAIFVTGVLAMHAIIMLFTFTTASFYDRYLVPVIPFTAALLIGSALTQRLTFRKPARSLSVAIAGMAAFGLLGFLYGDTAATIDGTKWKAADQAERLGFKASTIDGGFEWFGFHQPDPTLLVSGPNLPPARGAARTGWEALFSPRPVCATVVREPAPWHPVVASTTAHTAFGTTIRLGVARDRDPGCP